MVQNTTNNLNEKIENKNLRELNVISHNNDDNLYGHGRSYEDDQRFDLTYLLLFFVFYI